LQLNVDSVYGRCYHENIFEKFVVYFININFISKYIKIYKNNLTIFICFDKVYTI